MDPRYRTRFNAAFTPGLYAAYSADLAHRCGCEPGFRLAETPVFLDDLFRERCERAAGEIVAQLSDPARIARMRGALPERWTFAGETALPSFAVVDFAAVRAPDGTLEPKVVELQGFPSLFAFELMQADAWMDALAAIGGFGDGWTCCFGERSRAQAIELLRETILGGHDPAHVVLLDVDPPHQKTAIDFAATKRLFDVDAVDPRALLVRGDALFRRDERGRELPVRRIYYRLVADEVERRAIDLPFDVRRELDVEWAPHPNWFFTWSKSSLPFLDHPAVPQTQLLCDVADVLGELRAGCVLKPLFSFAGAGVNLTPTAADVAAIPERERDAWCLQERIEYAPALPAADGGAVKVEMRTMFARPDRAARLEPVTNLCRLSRGAMIGVDYNKDMTWVGSSVGLWRRSP